MPIYESSACGAGHTRHRPLGWKVLPADDRSSRIARRKATTGDPFSGSSATPSAPWPSSSWRWPRPRPSPRWSATSRSPSASEMVRTRPPATSSPRSCSACSPSATRRWPSTSPPPVRSTATSRTGSAGRRHSASGVIITMAYVVFEGSLIGIFSFFFQDFVKTQFDVDGAVAGARDPDAGAQLHPDVLRREPGGQGARGVPGHRDRHAVARVRCRCCSRAAARTASRSPRRSTPSARSSRRPASPARAPDSGCSSRSGRGSASSRRRCTARSPRTRSGSSRAPP